MATNYESGHNDIISNYQTLLFTIEKFPNYSPINPDLDFRVMQQKLENAQKAAELVNQLLNDYTLAVDARQNDFAPLSKLITRATNSYKSANLGADKVRDLQTITRKLTGIRAVPKSVLILEAKKSDQTSATTNDVALKIISASQMGYENRLVNLAQFTDFLEKTKFQTNENEISTQAFKQRLETAKINNSNLKKAQINLTIARAKRNAILYSKTTGLVDNATAAKQYIKSLFGAQSKEFAMVSKLKFVNKF